MIWSGLAMAQFSDVAPDSSQYSTKLNSIVHIASINGLECYTRTSAVLCYSPSRSHVLQDNVRDEPLSFCSSARLGCWSGGNMQLWSNVYGPDGHLLLHWALTRTVVRFPSAGMSKSNAGLHNCAQARWLHLSRPGHCGTQCVPGQFGVSVCQNHYLLIVIFCLGQRTQYIHCANLSRKAVGNRRNFFDDVFSLNASYMTDGLLPLYLHHLPFVATKIRVTAYYRAVSILYDQRRQRRRPFTVPIQVMMPVRAFVRSRQFWTAWSELLLGHTNRRIRASV